MNRLKCLGLLPLKPSISFKIHRFIYSYFVLVIDAANCQQNKTEYSWFLRIKYVPYLCQRKDGYHACCDLPSLWKIELHATTHADAEKKRLTTHWSVVFFKGQVRN
jgi:hypothetical protein